MFTSVNYSHWCVLCSFNFVKHIFASLKHSNLLRKTDQGECGWLYAHSQLSDWMKKNQANQRATNEQCSIILRFKFSLQDWLLVASKILRHRIELKDFVLDLCLPLFYYFIVFEAKCKNENPPSLQRTLMQQQVPLKDST